MPYIVGLTGGIGSGKSAAAQVFERMGATLVDTDAIAHELTAPGGGAMDAILAAFGPDYLTPEGALSRPHMRELVFAQPESKRRLEGILHPRIRAHSNQLVASATGPYVILMVPLLVESGDYRRRCQRILVVDCPEALQIERVKARSGIGEEQIRAIMATQATRAERLAAADDVIDNSGDQEQLRRAVTGLHQRYLQFASAARQIHRMKL